MFYMPKKPPTPVIIGKNADGTTYKVADPAPPTDGKATYAIENGVVNDYKSKGYTIEFAIIRKEK